MVKQKLTIAETIAIFWNAPPTALFDQNIISIVISRSPASLERARWAGFGGPPFKRIGNRSIRYEKQAVLDWINQLPTLSSTTQPK